MSNNFWNYQPQKSNQPSENNGVPRSGSLLSDYRQQQRQQPGSQQYAPGQPVPPRGGPPAPSMQPGQPILQHGGPPPGSQGWVSNAKQMVRRWSGRIAAVPPRTGIDPNQLVHYRPNQRTPAVVEPKAEPWKRSRTLRTSMRMRRRRTRWEHNNPNKRLIIGLLIAFCVVVLVTLSSGGASAYGYYNQQLPRLQGLANQQVSQTSRIYDRNGTLLYQAYDTQSQDGGRRTPVSLQYIPKVMQDAMIAAEDSTFWDNSGVNPVRIFSAASSDNGGASTLTQQLIKNLTHDAQPTLDRKISEAALAIGLTQQYTKAKILEMYFNIAPFGSKELGVDAAAEDYFGLKPLCDKSFNCVPAINFLAYPNAAAYPQNNAKSQPDPLLALARASLLAGMPQNPVDYDPTIENLVPGNTARALVRQQYVLGQMLNLKMQVAGLGQITPDIVSQTEALTAKMVFHPYKATIRDPHFVFWVIDQISNSLGDGDYQAGYHAFLTGGFNIRTTIDANLEAYVEAAVKHHIYDYDCTNAYPGLAGCGPLNTVSNLNDSAVIVMNSKDGEILAMDGSANYNASPKDKKTAGQVNATLAPRPPGSSFKPIVYATAFQEGWYPAIALSDSKTYFPGGPQNNISKDYAPPDYGAPNGHGGIVSIHNATANSYNIPAVKALAYTGLDNMMTMARRLGITSLDQYYNACKNNPNTRGDTVMQCFGLPMALGTLAIPPIQMTQAYQVFANGGVRVAPQGVLDIWDNYGHHLYHYDTAHPQGVRVLSPQVAFLVTSILDDEAARTEFHPLNTLSMWDWKLPDGTRPDVAAKTGTTDSFRDNWTMGYTPDVVVGVWSGNANNEVMRNIIGISGAGTIWHSVIERVMGGCNKDGIGIPCGPYKSPFHDRKFIPPAGIHIACVSTQTGLKGTGDCNWFINGEDPVQTGVTNNTPGNPPPPTP